MRTALAVAALSLAASTAACSREAPARRDRRVPAGDAASLLIDRNWLDTWPTDKDDHLHVYRFVPKMGGGVYQDRTVFKGTFELFTYVTDGESIEYHFPDDGLKRHSPFHIERVDGPEPFDLKLTIEGDPRGPGTYWGMTSDHLGDLDVLLRTAGRSAGK